MKTYKLYMHILPKEVSGKENDMYYIGITSKKETERWNNGKGYITNKRFFNYIKKYKWENFKHIVLLYGLSKQEAKEKEIEYIKIYNATNRRNGFNVSPGGNMISYETAKKIGDAQRENKNHRYGKTFTMSDSTKEKLSKGRLGEKNPNYGKKASEETRRKRSRSLMGHPVSEETRRKIGEGHKGMKVNREKMIPVWEANRTRLADLNKKEVYCVETGEEFDSLKSAAKSCNRSCSRMCMGIKAGEKVAGYHWKYKNNEVIL